MYKTLHKLKTEGTFERNLWFCIKNVLSKCEIMCVWLHYFTVSRYKYDWKIEEAKKNILRTHTTAVSARMLYKLAQEVRSE